MPVLLQMLTLVPRRLACSTASDLLAHHLVLKTMLLEIRRERPILLVDPEAPQGLMEEDLTVTLELKAVLAASFLERTLKPIIS